MDFLNSFVRNRGSRCWLSLGLFAAMFMLAVLISGCGSSGGHGSGGSSAQSFSDVIFRFKTMDSKVSARSLPDGTNTVRFTGSTSSREVLYGPVSKACAPQITLEEVSVKVTGFVLQYLSSDGALTGLYPVAVKMNLYGDTYVDIGDCPDLASVIADISVSPSSIGDLAIGYSESFTVTATLIDGQVVDLTPYITFTSSDESIATVSVNGADGAKVTGQAGGTAVISGSVLGVTIPDLSVTVDPGVVETGVLISPDNFVLAPGTTRNANAFVQFSNGTTKALDSSVVTWSVEPASGLVELTPSNSGDSSCSLLGDSNAKEGDSGLLKINVNTKAGNTFEAQATITISNKLPKSLALTNDTVGTTRQGLEENQIWDSGEYSSTKCTATATYTDGSTADVTDQVIWASSNTTVADFDPASPGRLQGASEGTTSVTATLGDVASPGMDITVVSGTAADFKIETDQDPETGIVLLYNSELGSEQIPVAVSAWALYPNGEKVYLNTTNSAVEIVDTNGAVHTDLVNVTDGDKCVKLAAAKLSRDSLNLRFTYEGVQSDLIPLSIKDRAPEVTYFSLVDTTTKTRWPLESSTDNEIELPIGRAYYVDVQGVWNDGTKGDFSQYYAIWDTENKPTGAIDGEDGKPIPITVTGTKVGENPEIDEEYKDWFLAGNASSIVTSRANIDGYVGKSIKVTCKGIYRTVSEGQTMFEVKITSGKPAIDSYVPLYPYIDYRGEECESYAFVLSGDNVDGIDFENIESKYVGSTMDDHKAYIDGAGSEEEKARRQAEVEDGIAQWASILSRVNSDDVVFSVARGTYWNVLGVGDESLKETQAIRAIYSDYRFLTDEEGKFSSVSDVKHTELVTGEAPIMQLDQESYEPLTSKFMLAKTGDGYPSVTKEDQYAGRNELGQTGVVKFDCTDAADGKYGKTVAGAEGDEWQSYHVSPGEFTIYLDRPRILGPVELVDDKLLPAPKVYLEGSSTPLEATSREADGTPVYEMERGQKFQFYYPTPELSDKDNQEFLKTTGSFVNPVDNQGNEIKVLAYLGNHAVKDYYQVQSGDGIVGKKATVTISPDSLMYSNYTFFIASIRIKVK